MTVVLCEDRISAFVTNITVVLYEGGIWFITSISAFSDDGICGFVWCTGYKHTHTTVVCCKDGVGPIGQLRTDYLHNSSVLWGWNGASGLVAAKPFPCGTEDGSMDAFPWCQLHIILHFQHHHSYCTLNIRIPCTALPCTTSGHHTMLSKSGHHNTLHSKPWHHPRLSTSGHYTMLSTSGHHNTLSFNTMTSSCTSSWSSSNNVLSLEMHLTAPQDWGVSSMTLL